MDWQLSSRKNVERLRACHHIESDRLKFVRYNVPLGIGSALSLAGSLAVSLFLAEPHNSCNILLIGFVAIVQAGVLLLLVVMPFLVALWFRTPLWESSFFKWCMFAVTLGIALEVLTAAVLARAGACHIGR